MDFGDLKENIIEPLINELKLKAKQWTQITFTDSFYCEKSGSDFRKSIWIYAITMSSRHITMS